MSSQRVQEPLEAFFKYKNAVFNDEQEKDSYYWCEDGIEKSVPWDHCLSSLGKPRNANQ